MRTRSQITNVIATALIIGACQTTSTLPDVKLGERPLLATEVANLWMVMDKAEASLKASGKIERDPILKEYVLPISVIVVIQRFTLFLLGQVRLL